MALKVEGSSPFTHPFPYRKGRFSPEQAWCNEIVGYRQAVRHRTLTPAFAGSNPASPVEYGVLAQSVEHLTFNQVVRGSNPRCLMIKQHLYPMDGRCSFFVARGIDAQKAYMGLAILRYVPRVSSLCPHGIHKLAMHNKPCRNGG